MADVINIGDFKLTTPRNLQTVAPINGCAHTNLKFVEHGEFLKCEDCNESVTAVWAFRRFCEQYRQMVDGFDFQRRSLEAERERGVTLRAAQMIEDAWRSRKMVPVCPHCHQGILPSSRFGASQVNRTLTKEGRAALAMEFREQSS